MFDLHLYQVYVTACYFHLFEIYMHHCDWHLYQVCVTVMYTYIRCVWLLLTSISGVGMTYTYIRYMCDLYLYLVYVWLTPILGRRVTYTFIRYMCDLYLYLVCVDPQVMQSDRFNSFKYFWNQSGAETEESVTSSTFIVLKDQTDRQSDRQTDSYCYIPWWCSMLLPVAKDIHHSLQGKKR